MKTTSNITEGRCLVYGDSHDGPRVYCVPSALHGTPRTPHVSLPTHRRGSANFPLELTGLGPSNIHSFHSIVFMHLKHPSPPVNAHCSRNADTRCFKHPPTPLYLLLTRRRFQLLTWSPHANHSLDSRHHVFRTPCPRVLLQRLFTPLRPPPSSIISSILLLSHQNGSSVLK